MDVHVVIMGCGRVGATLAHDVLARGHTTAVIDSDPAAFRRLGDRFGGEKVTGIGFDRDVLAAAGIDRADAFVAVSNGDNSNIISARVARETFGVARVIARVYDPGRAEVFERMGIPTVATVRWTADRVLRSIFPGEDTRVWNDPSGTVAMVETPVHPNWIGQRLSSLEGATGARVAYVSRFGVGVLPTASTVIQEGDQVFVMVTDDMTEHVAAVTAAPPEGAH